MRVVAAGCFVMSVLFAAVMAASAFGWFDRAPRVVGLAFAALVFAVAVLATWLFNRKGTKLEQFERDGLVESEDLEAVRAFGLEEAEDEGPSYYVELADRRVLFLSGQYLFDYEPIDDDPEWNQPRRFPCTAFTLSRHRKKGYVLDIACKGLVIEPETIAPPFTREDWKQGRIPRDGTFLTTSYDELKAARLGTAGSGR